MYKDVRYIIGLVLSISILSVSAMAEYSENHSNIGTGDNTQYDIIAEDEYENNIAEGGSGDSLGGRGVVTCEPPINVAKIERQKHGIMDNYQSTYTISDPDFGIYSISFIGKENESDIIMRAESLNDISKCRKVIPTVPGKIYKNTNVWLGSSLIQDAIIKFKVENAWLEDNNVSTPNVNVFQWNKYDQRWEVLDTKPTGEDSIYTYFESKANGLSQFAITGIRSEDDLKILTDYPADRANPIYIPKSGNNIKIITGIFAILIIGLTGAYYIIKKKK